MMISNPSKTGIIYKKRKTKIKTLNQSIILKSSQFQWTDHMSIEMSNCLKKSKRQKKG